MKSHRIDKLWKVFFSPSIAHLLAQGSHTTENSNGSLQILGFGVAISTWKQQGFFKGQLKGPGDPCSAISDHEIKMFVQTLFFLLLAPVIYVIPIIPQKFKGLPSAESVLGGGEKILTCADRKLGVALGIFDIPPAPNCSEIPSTS